MKSHELMLISVYPEMLEDIQAVCQTMHIEPTILQWEIAQQGLLDKLNQMFLELPKPDVIISRGATAGMIEQYFPGIVSIRAEPDNLEILEILNKAREYGSRIGLILFDEYVDHYKIKTVEHLLDVEEVRIYPFRSRADIESQVLRGKRDGMDVMVGGGTLALRMGKQCGMNVCFVESGRLSLKKAIRQAESIIYARQREKLQLKCFSSAASSIQEGILSTENGTIVVANQEMGHILNINERLILNKKAEALPSSLMAPCILTFMFHDTADDGILKINGQNYYVKKSTARSKTNQRIIAVFQGTHNIQYQEQRVRSELRNNGFMAKYTFEDIVAESALMKSLMDKAGLYASTNAGILINGNSGTGKELLAQSIHNASPRHNQPFVAVNCAAIPASLLESELFGYEEGAFSGAKKGGKRGLFELAHKGTIFLDEINSMPIELQSVLLRTIQEKEIRRVGAQKNIYVDIRIISACNKNMEELIADGKFRADLYYRLNTLKLTMPDLETRKEDIPPLCRYFLKRYSAKYSVPIPALSPEDSEILLKRSWPGNVRELENTMHRYVILSSLQHCSVNDCLDGTPPKQAASSGASQPPLEGTLAQMELALIRKCLEENHGSREKTAKQLGISRSTLWKKLSQQA